MRVQQVLLFILLFVLLVCAGALLLLGEQAQERVSVPQDLVSTTSTSSVPALDEQRVLPYGEVTARLGVPAQIAALTLRVLSLDEESRCPRDVQCIQAGTVRITLETVSGLGTSTQILALGDMMTTETERITFMGADPYPVTTDLSPAEVYTFRFKVEPHTANTPVVIDLPQQKPIAGECFVGGCSSQLCSDTPDMVSTCEYRESYACYAKAMCERQEDGACGWTPTPQLDACLVAGE